MLSIENLSPHLKRPKVSVVIPCWNSAATLPSTLASLISQEFTDWECIIVDDGSTDKTSHIIDEICLKDRRFVSQKTSRLGPSNARNLASQNYAKGELLAFLDSDDVWLPQRLRLVVEQFDHDIHIDASYAKVAFFKNCPNKHETYSTVYRNALSPVEVLRDNPVCTMSNLVIKTKVFKANQGFDKSIVHNEDVEFLVRAISGGANIVGIDKVLVCYRTNLAGLSSDLVAMRAGWHRALQSLQSTSFCLTPQQIAEANAGNLRYLARRALRTGAPGFDALKLSLQGIYCSPKSFFNPLWRGGMTLIGSFATVFLPSPIRKLVFNL
jgi:glycosyltransferase involved in cell wall biosynthesis